jgi:hypothetical protein
MLSTHTLPVESKSLVRILVPAGLVIMAVLVGRVHRLFWNDLAVSTVVILGACARTNSRRAQLVSWSTAICGVWLVISPSLLGDETPDLMAWSSIVGGFILGSFEIVRLSTRNFRRPRRFRAGNGRV